MTLLPHGELPAANITPISTGYIINIIRREIKLSSDINIVVKKVYEHKYKDTTSTRIQKIEKQRYQSEII